MTIEQKTAVIIDIKARADELAPGLQEAERQLGTLADKTKGAGQSVQEMARQAAAGDWEGLATQAGRTALAFGAIGLAVGAAAGGVAMMAKAYVDGAKEVEGMNHALGMTGNFAGQTAASMRTLAESMAGGKLTIGEAKEAVTALAASGRVGADAFAAVAQATAAYARATGQAASDVAGKMERMFADPVKGAEELARSMRALTAADLDHIEHLQRTGQVTEAQLALAEKVTSALRDQAQNLGLVERAWAGAKGAASSFWDAAMGIGRRPDAEAMAAATAARIAYLQSDAAKNLPTDVRERELASLSKTLAIEQNIARLKKEEVKDAAATADYNDKSIRARALIKANSPLAKTSADAEDVQLMQQFGSGPFRDDAIAAKQKAMQNRWKTAGAKDGRDWEFEQQRMFDRLSGKDLDAAQKEIERIGAAWQKTLEQTAAAEWRQAEALSADTKRMQEQLDTLGLHGEALGNYRAQKLLAAAAAEESAAATSREQAAMLEEADATSDLARLHHQLAAAREESARALRSQASIARETAVKQEGLKLAEEAKRQSERISQDLTSALMRGFEGGKRGAEALRDTLKNYFATLVLEPLIRPIVQPFADKASGLGNAIAGLFSGGGGGASGAGLDLGAGRAAWDALAGMEIPSFDVGSSFVPRDTLAFVHRGERILTAAENRSGGGAVVHMPLTVHIDSRTDAASVRGYVLQAASLAERRLMQSARTGGTWAAAMGKA